LYVPNTFTPNGDGKNEVFLPIIKDQLSYNFQIFDRWGNLVFQTNDANQGWDGEYKGQKSPDGTYVYQLNFTPPQDGLNHLVRGHVNLLR
jgi:gliding motility-associated-like protein